MKARITIACVCALACAGAARAQDTPGLAKMKVAQDQAQEQALLRQKLLMVQAARMPLEREVKGAPYSAETVTESVQQLPDGNAIRRKTTGRVYRDSEGRTRREEDRQDGSVGISIVDPVANVSYMLDPAAHVAWKTPSAVGAVILDKLAAERRMLAGAPPAPAAGGQYKVETARGGEYKMRTGGAGEAGGVMMKAGNVTTTHTAIDGIAVDCTSGTTVLPAGAIGNDQPMTITSEQCSSPDLKVLVRTKHTDPRTGDSTYRLTNIVRAEPDPSLFQVPPGYTIKETGIRHDQH